MDTIALTLSAAASALTALLMSLLQYFLMRRRRAKSIVIDGRTISIDLSDSERVRELLDSVGGPPRAMMIYAHDDVAFVRRLVSDLERHGVSVWFAEREIKVGDSVSDKVNSGLGSSGYAIAVLSRSSSASRWVGTEMSLALRRQREGRPPTVLPALVEDVDLPSELTDRAYADFREDYEHGLQQLLAAVRQR